MAKVKHEYHISFFQPGNPHATENRNMVLVLTTIWAVAIFGFQTLLWIIEEPTPEPSYTIYDQIKGDIQANSADSIQYLDYARVNLQVLSKVFISPADRQILQESMNWAFFHAVAPEQRSELIAEIREFEQIKELTTDILDPNYIEAKFSLADKFIPLFGLDISDVRTRILPLELSSTFPGNFAADLFDKTDLILSKYLIHNESILTRTIFLGFPFHYFYTAVFLLVLFIFLCWVYCVRTDALNKKYGIIE